VGPFWADIHLHTTCSDGSLLPVELLLFAQKLGLKGVSITDHDTVAAYTDNFIQEARKMGIVLGSGVEFSCHFNGVGLHILGYDFDLTNTDLQHLCQKHIKRREKRNRSILEKLEKQNMVISYEELQNKAKGGMIGRFHLGEVMVEKKYVKTLADCFNLYIGENGSCYVRGDVFDVQESIEIIHSAGGKAFIAHPHLLSKEISLENLLALPFDGLEAFYARLQKEPWIKIAKKKKWIASGGSDFHSVLKLHSSIGSNGVDRETFYKIFRNPL
jgi:3',5'-nucleoside bisphosphate phosphatase